jgi:hypothetical protein
MMPKAPLDERVRCARSRWLCAALLSLPFGVGALLMGLSPRTGGTPSCRTLLRASFDHLARCDHAARIRVSSNNFLSGHHPIFLIDGRVGGLSEKWVSLEGDKRPWAEISWDAPRVVQRVVIHHAGVREHASLNTRDFTIWLRRDGRWHLVATAEGNEDAVTAHVFPPFQATALRLEISKASAASSNAARIYEIEAHER